MTITMTSKNQVTLPKSIVETFGFDKGSTFDVRVNRNHIELVPVTVEIKELTFTKKELAKLKQLTQKERGQAKKVTKKFIEDIRGSQYCPTVLLQKDSTPLL